MNAAELAQKTLAEVDGRALELSRDEIRLKNALAALLAEHQEAIAVDPDIDTWEACPLCDNYNLTREGQRDGYHCDRCLFAGDWATVERVRKLCEQRDAIINAYAIEGDHCEDDVVRAIVERLAHSVGSVAQERDRYIARVKLLEERHRRIGRIAAGHDDVTGHHDPESLRPSNETLVWLESWCAEEPDEAKRTVGQRVDLLAEEYRAEQEARAKYIFDYMTGKRDG